MKRKLFFGIALTIACVQGQAQDIHFSQFYMSPLTLNPALAGSSKCGHRAALNYRSQWKAIHDDKSFDGKAGFDVEPHPYQTVAASYDGAFGRKNSRPDYWGLGVNVFQDQAGAYKMGIMQANASIVYHRNMNRSNLISLGFQGGYAQRSLSGLDKGMWGNQYNTSTYKYEQATPSGEDALIINTKPSFVDLSVGGVWTYDKNGGKASPTNSFKSQLGAAYFHASSPKQSFYDDTEGKLDGKIVVHTTVELGFDGGNKTVIPSVVFYKQGAATQILMGSLFKFKLNKETAVYLGGFYRNKDAIIIAAKADIGPMALGVSYDINISGLKVVSKSQGGFELSLTYCVPPTKGSQSRH